MALSHMTGLPIGYDENAGPLKFKFEPGTELGYSGIPYLYLQKAVEKQTKSTLEALTKELIFGPLGMNNSSYYPMYEIGLVSEKTRKNGKIYLGKTADGLRVEVIGLSGKLEKATIPWNQFPEGFPREPSGYHH